MPFQFLSEWDLICPYKDLLDGKSFLPNRTTEFTTKYQIIWRQLDDAIAIRVISLFPFPLSLKVKSFVAT